MVDIKEVYQISEMLLNGDLNNIGGHVSYNELKTICKNNIELANTVILDLTDRGIVEQYKNSNGNTGLMRID